jgi:tRNA uridine 5-carbamoylmethylation protein Kti12
MYSVTELAKIFNTTRKTIYTKLETDNIQSYVEDTKQGKRLKKEGFNILQLLMSESKVTEDKQNNSVTYTEHIQDHINSLKSQIETLRIDKDKQIEELKEEIKYFKEEKKTEVEFLREQLKQTQLLTETKKQEKKSFWDKLFKN